MAELVLVRSMSRVALVASAFILSGCASALYDWNIQHAHIASTVSLPQAERDQIVHTVTDASLRAILCISGGKDHVFVYTDFQHDPERYWVYELQKQRDGTWRITSDGEGSIIVCD